MIIYIISSRGAVVQLVGLTNFVGMVAAIHKCLPKCIMSNKDNIVEHYGSIVEDVYAIMVMHCQGQHWYNQGSFVINSDMF